MDYHAFAIEWEAVWNSHNLDRILAHYAEDVIFRSQKAMRLKLHETIAKVSDDYEPQPAATAWLPS